MGNPAVVTFGENPTCAIADLQDEKYTLVTVDTDVDAIADILECKRKCYDGFLVVIEDGDYSEAWGFYGCVPFLRYRAFRVK